ncbi:MAG: hypothetical protein ABIH08_06685 [Candidatus Omnitrophota bacterium]
MRRLIVFLGVFSLVFLGASTVKAQENPDAIKAKIRQHREALKSLEAQLHQVMGEVSQQSENQGGYGDSYEGDSGNSYLEGAAPESSSVQETPSEGQTLPQHHKPGMRRPELEGGNPPGPKGGPGAGQQGFKKGNPPGPKGGPGAGQQGFKKGNPPGPKGGPGKSSGGVNGRSGGANQDGGKRK